MCQRFERKTVVITNANGILGLACARLFHDEGANVVVNDAGIESMREIEKELKNRLLISNENLTRLEGAKRMINATLSSFGTIDVLVCNEGCPEPKSIQEIDTHFWEKSVDLDLLSTFHTLQAVYNTFKEKESGSIVLVSSLGAKSGVAGAVNYSSSSGSILGIMKSISKEWSRWGITCSAVCPGVIEEGEQGIPANFKDQFEQTQVELASTRNVTANEVAKVILFMASEDGRPINGQTINVDYGLHVFMF